MSRMNKLSEEDKVFLCIVIESYVDHGWATEEGEARLERIKRTLGLNRAMFLEEKKAEVANRVPRLRAIMEKV